MNYVFYFIFFSLPGIAQASAILLDDGEHGVCYGLETSSAGKNSIPFRSTCKNDGSGNISLTYEAARTGQFGYKLPISIRDVTTPQLIQGTGIHSAKMTANSTFLTKLQIPGSTLRYSAYFFIKSGFDDTAWHIQMQWKAFKMNTDGKSDFWSAQNPKIAWGFRKLETSENKTSPLQVVVTVREAHLGRCDAFSYDLLTRQSTMGLSPIPIPKLKWVKVTTEIYFHETNGYIHMWQGEDSAQMIINANNINTVSQLVPSGIAKPSDSPCVQSVPNVYHYTNPSHFNFSIANYMSGRSFQPEYKGNEDDHILYIDDIAISILESKIRNAPEPPKLLGPQQP